MARWINFMPGPESYQRPKLELLNKTPKREGNADIADARALCRKLGIKFADIEGSEIPLRWRELGQSTRILKDELQSVEHAKSVDSFLRSRLPDRALTSGEVSVIKAATLLTDISKTGWSGAIPTERQVITKIYAEDARFDTKKTLGEFVDSFFSREEASAMKISLEGMRKRGISPNMTFREFINLHAGWSY